MIFIYSCDAPATFHQDHMRRFWINRLTLALLYFHAMGKAFLRFRDPRRRASGRNLDAFYKQTWRDAAATLGGTYKPLGENFSEITVGGVSTRVTENVSGIDDPVTLGILHDKMLTAEILKAEGIATPRHVRFSMKEMAPAVAFLAGTDRHCVVKPASGTGGGRGVTTGIRRISHLARAAAAATATAMNC